MTKKFTNGHKSSIRGLSFSPLNKLLMCSVGIDRHIVFYDVNEGIIVKRIETDTPLQSVAFCTDGHTLAAGANGKGSILLYDLRMSTARPKAVLEGHKHTVNCVNFVHKTSSSSSIDKKKECSLFQIIQRRTALLQRIQNQPTNKTRSQEQHKQTSSVILTSPSEHSRSERSTEHA
mmetsp:Transcript_13812/g.9773  ORF Transcript_13812/g.9773 Transcript_13812/m.9773 type:complete len:176 (+) Transcript_13812:601-1128(+)